MFSTISWFTYFLSVVLFLLAYYFMVIVKFYLPDIHTWITLLNQRKKRLSPVLPNDLMLSSSMEVKNVGLRLIAAISDGVKKKLIKEELSTSLERILKGFPNLKNTPSQSLLNELIVSECAKQGYGNLKEEDVWMLWNEVN